MFFTERVFDIMHPRACHLFDQVGRHWARLVGPRMATRLGHGVFGKGRRPGRQTRSPTGWPRGGALACVSAVTWFEMDTAEEDDRSVPAPTSS